MARSSDDRCIARNVCRRQLSDPARRQSEMPQGRPAALSETFNAAGQRRLAVHEQTRGAALKDATRCVVHPEVSHEGYASLSVPTARASTIVFPDGAGYASRNERSLDGYSYGLHGTPTTRTLEAQVAALEEGEKSVLLPSGLSAITVVMLTTLRPGDSILIPETAYPPVARFCENYLKPMGISHRIYDPLIGSGIASLMDATTRLVWTESPGSATMEVQDIPAIVEAAHKSGALVACDNTWATPLLFKPLRAGVDFSIQALTKYASGHSDLLMGAVTVRDLDLRARLRRTMLLLGLGVAPDTASLVLRGLESMSARLAHVGRIAQDFAQRLEEGLKGCEVRHPALATCPGHAAWRRDFAGASGLFSVMLPPACETRMEDALRELRTFVIGASWGGTRSILAPMRVTRSRPLLADVYDGPLLRISIGLEDPDDLWTDLENIMRRLGVWRAQA